MPADKLVATTLAIPMPPPLQGASMYDGPVSWMLSAVAAFMAAVFWLRRKASRDNTEITKDKAEANLVTTLREERDRAMNEAREAWARRTNDAQRIAQLEAENEYLKRDVQRLSAQVSDLASRFDMVTGALAMLRPDFKIPMAKHPPLDLGPA